MFVSMVLGKRDLMVNQTQKQLQKKKEGLLSLESWARKKIVTSQHVHAVLHAKIRYYGS